MTGAIAMKYQILIFALMLILSPDAYSFTFTWGHGNTVSQGGETYYCDDGVMITTDGGSTCNGKPIQPTAVDPPKPDTSSSDAGDACTRIISACSSGDLRECKIAAATKRMACQSVSPIDLCNAAKTVMKFSASLPENLKVMTCKPAPESN